jgi:hypothetical protein
MPKEKKAKKPVAPKSDAPEPVAPKPKAPPVSPATPPEEDHSQDAPHVRRFFEPDP